jgi:hypothetical protein
LPTLTFTISPTVSRTSTATVNPASADLNRLVVYPNPYRENRNSRKQIVFKNLPEQAVIRCYSLDGKLVRTLEKNDTTGQLIWDLKSQADSPIASGIYLYVIKSAGQTTKGKVAILR